MYSLKKKFLVTVTVSFAVGVFFLLSYWWLVLEIFEVDSSIRAMRNATKFLEEERSEAKRTDQYLKGHEQELARIKKVFLPRDEKPIEFIENIEGLARATKSRHTLSFDEGRSRGSDLYFSLSLTGGETDVREFLRILEHMPYYLTVGEFSFSVPLVDQSQTPGTTLRGLTAPEQGSAYMKMVIHLKTL